MNRFSLSARAVSLAALAAFSLSPLQAQQPSAPDQAAAQARDLLEKGNYPEAAKAFEQLLKDFPTSMVVSEAQYRLAVTYYILGEHDKSLDLIKKLVAPPTPPEITELAFSLRPRVTSAKAAKLPDGDAKRKPAYEEAIKQYDEYLTKYPQGDEGETARYGRALACFQIEKYDDAIKTLRDNIALYKNSESIADSKYLMALALYSQSIQLLFGDKPDVTAATPKLNEAQTVLGDVIKSNDIALANEAQFQLGEILSARARFVPESERPTLYKNAIDAYRAVKPRDKMVEAQQARLANFGERARQALLSGDKNAIRKLGSLRQRETEKLEILKNKPDQCLTAMIREGVAFFQAGRYDEARTIFNYAEKYATEGQPKRDLLYYRTLTYVSQAPADNSEANRPLLDQLTKKAVADYDKFESEFKGDPIGENLPVAVAKMFVSGGAPDKALPYLSEATQNYPKTRLASDIAVLKASCYLQLKQFDEGLKSFDEVLKANPSKEVAASAQLGKASIFAQTKKVPEAIAEFKKVRDTYPGTSQAEQAQYNIAGLTLGKGDYKGAITEFGEFLKQYPQSTTAPEGSFLYALAYELSGDKATAITKYQDSLKAYPQGKNAADCYIRTANIYANDQKPQDMERTIREFADKFPDSPKVFNAFKMLAQTNLAAQKIQDALSNYREVVEKHPNIPNIADAWRELADLSLTSAQRLGNYLAMPEDQRTDWEKGVNGAISAAEKLVEVAPDSPQVPAALKDLVAAQDLLVKAKKKSDADVEKYFRSLSEKYADKPGTRSKIMFALAGYTYGRDRQKAVQMMSQAYDPSLAYAPADVDLYGGALLADNRADDAINVYQDLANDYPNPANVAPEKAPVEVQQAQSIALYGIGKALSLKGQQKEATEKFEDLKKLYPWSPKIMEANLGIAQQAYTDKNYDEASQLVLQIIRSSNAAVDTKGNAMLLLARCFEAKSDWNNAIDNYARIATFCAAATQPAAEGLYKSAELIVQKQVPGFTDPKDAPKKKTQLAKARTFLEKCVKDYAVTDWAEKSKTLLAQIPKE